MAKKIYMQHELEKQKALEKAQETFLSEEYKKMKLNLIEDAVMHGVQIIRTDDEGMKRIDPMSEEGLKIRGI